MPGWQCEMGSILWLASYPKSGNTWLRALLTNYKQDVDTPADINKLRGGPIASSRDLFDEMIGFEASELTDSQIAQLRPVAYRRLAAELSEGSLLKVHDAWTIGPTGEPLFPADVTAGVVYIVRNPLDVAVSAASHWGVDLARAVEHLCNPNMALARSHHGLVHLPVVVKLFVAKRDQLKGVFWALVRAPVCLG